MYNFLIDPLGYLATFGEGFQIDEYLGTYSLVRRPVYCVMCGYNEQENIELALASLVGKIEGLIFIDKNGALKEYVEKYSSSFRVHYEARPDLNLRESRRYALTLIPFFTWVLIVDADELLLMSREDLEALMVRKVCYRTRMNIIIHGEGLASMNAYHNFFMYHDGSIFFRKKRDIPRYRGRHINLGEVCKENRAWVKSKRHLFYRFMYWKPWQYSIQRRGPIEDYIRTLGELPTDEEVDAWHEEFKKNPAAYRANSP